MHDAGRESTLATSDVTRELGGSRSGMSCDAER